MEGTNLNAMKMKMQNLYFGIVLPAASKQTDYLNVGI